jgi:hypothetical protein
LNIEHVVSNVKIHAVVDKTQRNGAYSGISHGTANQYYVAVQERYMGFDFLLVSSAMHWSLEPHDMAINDLAERKDLLDVLGHEICSKHPSRKVCSVLCDVSVANEVEATTACVVEYLGMLDVVSRDGVSSIGSRRSMVP